MLQIGALVRVVGDPERNQYMVCGRDEASGRIWLAATDPEYDGYNGDLILAEGAEGTYLVALADSRCSLTGPLELQVD